MLRHALTNFEIKHHYKNETQFNGVYSRNNLFSWNDFMHDDKVILKYTKMVDTPAISKIKQSNKV